MTATTTAARTGAARTGTAITGAAMKGSAGTGAVRKDGGSYRCIRRLQYPRYLETMIS